MKFINRHEEIRRLDRVARRESSALVVVSGRRRVGKSRLLAEWTARHGGLYWVADESGAAIQRRYLADELEAVLPGFAAVEYPDWTVLLNRLSRDAAAAGWHGPLVLDEFPYLIAQAPELPSVVQKWIDREKRQGGITLALAGSSQRMMQSAVLDASAPLYGRADEVLRVTPLAFGFVPDAIATTAATQSLDFFTCWGGMPRYWELAVVHGADQATAVDELVLSPLGPLHDEVDRLLRQEMPSAITLRPVLDAIGLGAHRSSEIAGRLQMPATAITRPLAQLQELGYVRREVPFGENEKRTKRSLYRLADPFLRLWFRTVAAHRGSLQTATVPARRRYLTHVWPQLRAETWEELCREAIPRLATSTASLLPAARSWAAGAAEWDAVSSSTDGGLLVLAECKASAAEIEGREVQRIVAAMEAKSPPPTRRRPRQRELWVCSPAFAEPRPVFPPHIRLVDGHDVLGALSEPQ
jgi:AAA+ ATPase superfamily predicted ATPase